MNPVGGRKDEPASPSEMPTFATYDEALEGLVQWVEITEQALTDWELELALNGAWMDWSRDQSVGTVIEFSSAMFLECDDEVVQRLERARIELARVLTLIERGRRVF